MDEDLLLKFKEILKEKNIDPNSILENMSSNQENSSQNNTENNNFDINTFLKLKSLLESNRHQF